MAVCPRCYGNQFEAAFDSFGDVCWEPCTWCGGEGSVSVDRARLYLSRRAARVVSNPSSMGEESFSDFPHPRPSRRGFWGLFAALSGRATW